VIDRKTIYYLICQLAGWSLLWLFPLLANGSTILKSTITVFPCLIVTHMLRNIIRSRGWLGLPAKKAWPYLLQGVAVACVVAGLIKKTAFLLFTHIPDPSIFGILRLLIVDVLNFFFLIPTWAIIYCGYHYAAKWRKANLGQKQLEWRLNEMTTEAQEEGINLDQLMDALSKIRDSIPEDPVRARNQLTLFSRLLRKGYFQTE